MIKCWWEAEYKCPLEPACRPDWPRGDLSLFEFYPHKLLPRQTAFSTHSFILIFIPPYDLKYLAMRWRMQVWSWFWARLTRESLIYTVDITIANFLGIPQWSLRGLIPPRPSPMWPAVLLPTLSICHFAFFPHHRCHHTKQIYTDCRTHHDLFFTACLLVVLRVSSPEPWLEST